MRFRGCPWTPQGFPGSDVEPCNDACSAIQITNALAGAFKVGDQLLVDPPPVPEDNDLSHQLHLSAIPEKCDP
jgi:hypothetical protein